MDREEAKKILRDAGLENIRRILEKTWEIQKRTGKPVSIDELVKELNKD